MTLLDAVRLSLAVLWFAAGMSGSVAAQRRTARRNAGTILLGATAGAVGSVGAIIARGARAGFADPAFVVVGAALGVVVASVFDLLVSMPHGRPPSIRRSFRAGVFAVCALIGAATFADRPHVHWAGLVVVAIVLAGVGSWIAYGRYRRTTPLEQRSLRWLGAAGLAMLVIASALASVWMLGWHQHVGIAALAATAVLPVCVIVSARSRLLPIVDDVIERLCGAVAAAGLLTGVVVLLTVSRDRALTAGERRLVAVMLVGFALAAVIRNTVGRRVVELVADIAYAGRPGAGETRSRFTARLTRAVPLQELFEQLCESLRASMRLESAELWTLTGDRLSTVAASPHRHHQPVAFDPASRTTLANTPVSGGTWLEIWLPSFVSGRPAANMRVAPLVHAGEVLGLLACERSPTGDPFIESFDADLRELARSVALALHNLRLDAALQASVSELRVRNEELVESRSRIVAAGDAQRRQIERDLHDGAQQRLVAMAVKLHLVRSTLSDDTEGATELLTEMSVDLTDAIEELRTLAHGIFPPLLVSGGLGRALPAAAARSTLATTVSCEGVSRHELAVEAAVYFCCVEALQNAAKHAGEQARVTVRVWQEGGDLCFEVRDDGAGFHPATAPSGHGFANMADRLGAFHGVLTIDSAPDVGTRIYGRIPVLAAQKSRAPRWSTSE